MEIFVRIKHVYGKKLIYPVCEQATLLTRLTGNKTIGDHELNIIKQLGYTVSAKGEQL